MKALVLAAGRGERVRPLTERIPKPMLEVGGRPLIHYVLAMLRRGGVTEVVINVHHLAAEIQRGLGNGARFGMEIVYSPEPTLFGTGGPLNALAGYFGGEPFVVANSDGILDLDLQAMLRFHRDRGAIATLALCRPETADLYSRIEIDDGSRVRRMRLLKGRNPSLFDEYPLELGPIEPQALEPFTYCGALVAEASVLKLMPKSPPWSVMAGLFAPMVAQGLPIFGFVHRGYFRTVDDLEGYQALRHQFETSPPRLAFADPG
jgi:NDP-sugar pyrophosphorylase family protein